MDADEFPANKSKIPTRPGVAKEEAPREKIVQGEVIRRKKPLGRRFSEAFLGGDARSVGEYVVLDVLIPAAKDTIADAVSQGVERMVFGEVRSTARRHRTTSGYTPYGSASRNRASEPRMMSRANRARHNFEEIIIETRVEATEIIENMMRDIDKYGQISVAALYEMVGITSSHIDMKWGWVDATDFGLRRVREGYLLDLPKPELL